MADINVTVLEGRIVRDAELRTTGGGTNVLKLAIANNYAKKVNGEWEEVANFFDCVMIGPRGEKICQYLTKGTKVTIKAEARQNRWQDDAKNNRSKIEFMIHDISFGGKSQNQGANDEQKYQGDAAASQNSAQSAFDDDVPF